MDGFNIGFIGAGKMATAIANGLLKRGFKRNSIKAFDISTRAGESFQNDTGVKVTDTMDNVLKGSDLVVVAVKPQHVDEALKAQRSLASKTIMSIAAGVTLAKLAELTGSRKIARVMPNTPALIGKGVSAYCLSPGFEPEEEGMITDVLKAVGDCHRIDESLMDAVTGLSGSGPAYVYTFIEGLIQGGVYAGLPQNTARDLAVRTVLGAAAMVLETGGHPAELRDNVTSPGGTTSRGLDVLSQRSFQGIVTQAVAAAAERSRELSEA